MRKIKKGDTVVVCGTTINNAGIKSVHRGLAKVIEVGKHDAFVSQIPKGEYSRPYRIPLTRCQKIDLQEGNLLDDIVEPKVGDLVMSVSYHFGKIEQNIGTVKEIVNKPGELKHAVCAHSLGSTKEFKVSYSTLIVLED